MRKYLLLNLPNPLIGITTEETLDVSVLRKRFQADSAPHLYDLLEFLYPYLESLETKCFAAQFGEANLDYEKRIKLIKTKQW